MVGERECIESVAGESVECPARGWSAASGEPKDWAISAGRRSARLSGIAQDGRRNKRWTESDMADNDNMINRRDL